MNDNLIDQLRVPDTDIPNTDNSDAVTNTVNVDEGWFIRGPIPGDWIGRAAHLPGNHTLHVALTVLHVSGLPKNNKVVTLERFHFDRFGVKKDSVRRALKRLREAGLIKYMKTGQKYKVTVIPIES
jgi:DNA-binding transcriptional ArsR family regulator